MNRADRILLTGVRATGHHGVLPQERRTGQEFVVDLELELDLAVAAATDDVAGTVHYGELAEAVVAAVERDPVDLIETLADRIADVVLAHELVSAVVVTVHKPSAPIPVPFGDVAVRLRRARPLTAPRHAVIALGANLGDREAVLDGAVAALRRLRGLRIDAVSATAQTVAVTPHGPDPSRPRYANRVAVGASTLDAEVLLADLLAIEQVFGRVRGERWGDRTLDLDLIALGDERRETDPVLPHPRAHERGFVLRPWIEVEPDAVLPGRGRVRHLVAALREEA